MPEFQSYSQKAMELLMGYAPKVLLAVLFLIVSLWIIKFVLKGMEKAMERAKLEESLRKFLRGLVGVIMQILLLISVASMVGIATTSFIAVLGAAGLAVGLALQGSLANFAGGVLILLFRPFKVGDFIDAQGHMGTVRDIQIINTVLKTPDNKTIIIPNGSLANNSIVNFSTEPSRRVDMAFGIGYGDDIKKAKEILSRLVKEDSRFLTEPAPVIVVSELGDSSVNFTVRAWVNSGDYWTAFFDMQENVKLTFDAEGISIPFPQRDVHLFQNE